jgi:Bacterial surface protein, Ig-like domain
MKKITLLFAAMAIIASAAIFTSCEVEDLSAPVITLTDGASVDVVLGGTWAEPGFTATDDEDGDITASVTVTGTVNTALTGNYDLVYTVTDVAGNVGTTTRTVRVYNESEGWDGTFSAIDTEDGTTYPAETRTVNYSTTVNNRLFLIKFSGRTDADCYGDINTAANTINLPTQNFICGASPQQDMTFAGSGNLNTTTSVMTITYTVGLTGGSTSLNCNTIYTKN